MPKYRVVNRQTLWVEWYGQVQADSEESIERSKVIWEGKDTMRIIDNLAEDDDEWDFELITEEEKAVKKYEVSFSWIDGKSYDVEAENEAEAKAIATEKFENDPELKIGYGADIQEVQVIEIKESKDE